jgi:hypothetical protein
LTGLENGSIPVIGESMVGLRDALFSTEVRNILELGEFVGTRFMLLTEHIFISQVQARELSLSHWPASGQGNKCLPRVTMAALWPQISVCFVI